MVFDKIDKKILSLLEQDGRLSFSELALAVGLSKSPCWNRVKDLQNKGIIKGYKAILDEHLLGVDVHAIVHVVVNFSLSAAFEDEISAHKNVLSCFAVTGDYDYVLNVVAPNISTFDDLLRKELSRIAGVERFSTAIATRTIKHDQLLANIL